MRRPFVSALVAILITEMSLGALFFAPRPTWLWHLAAMPALPAHGLTLRLGLGGGPEGFPLFSDAALHVVRSCSGGRPSSLFVQPGDDTAPDGRPSPAALAESGKTACPRVSEVRGLAV
jgi:hypothetical protein